MHDLQIEKVQKKKPLAGVISGQGRKDNSAFLEKDLRSAKGQGSFILRGGILVQERPKAQSAKHGAAEQSQYEHNEQNHF